jgi:hypothetical protein
VRWYVSGDKRRVDEKSVGVPEGETPWMLPVVRETAWSPEERIYYHHFQKFPAEAYINKPWPEGFKFVRGVTTYFDPMLFFCPGDYSSLEEIAEQCGTALRVSTENTGEGNRYKVYGEKVAPTTGFKTTLELEIDPGQGYNVTKMRIHSSGYAQGPLAALDVTYTDGGTNGRSYFPATYHYHIEGGDLAETVDVNFSEVVLNQPVDPVVFTFEGMGVKPGTKVIDMRYGEHIYSYYKGLPVEELNKLAGEIQKEEWAQPSPVPTVNTKSDPAAVRRVPVGPQAPEETEPNTRGRPAGDAAAADPHKTLVSETGIPSWHLLIVGLGGIVVMAGVGYVIHRKIAVSKK